MHGFVRRVASGHFFRAAAAVSLARGAGQAAILLSTLFCTNYFSPAEVGKAGLFMGVASVVALFSSFRLESAALRSRSTPARRKYIGLAYWANAIVFIAVLAVTSTLTILDYAEWYFTLLAPMVFLLSKTTYVLPAQYPNPSDASSIGRVAFVTSVVVAGGQLVAAFLSPSSIALIAVRLIAGSVGWATLPASLTRGLAYARGIRGNEVRRLWRPNC